MCNSCLKEEPIGDFGICEECHQLLEEPNAIVVMCVNCDKIAYIAIDPQLKGRYYSTNCCWCCGRQPNKFYKDMEKCLNENSETFKD